MLFKHSVYSGLHTTVLFSLVILLLIPSCKEQEAGSAFSGAGTTTGNSTNVGTGPVRTDFAGIYGGSVGTRCCDTGIYFSYARLFIASNGSGFAYKTSNDSKAWEDLAGEQFIALSFGSKSITTDNSRLNMDADGFSYRAPNPRDSGPAILTGALEGYSGAGALISGISVTGPGNFNVMDNNFSFSPVELDEDTNLTMPLLENNFTPWIIVSHRTLGFADTYVNIGNQWAITVNGTNSSFTVNIAEDVADNSGCSVSNGIINLIDTTKNEFSITFDLACTDAQVNGSYTGVGYLDTEESLISKTYHMSFAVQMDADNTKYLTFFD